MRINSILILLPRVYEKLKEGVALALSATAVLGPAAGAQVVADRPDFVEAATVVGRGAVQIETSFSFATSNDLFGGSVDTWTTPTLFRIGVSERVEIRVESDWYVHSVPSGDASTDGFADIAVGAKIALADGEAFTVIPAAAVLLHADLPTGSDAFSGVGVRPSVRFVAEWELPGNVGVGVMPGIVLGNSGAGRFLAGIFGAVASKGWTDQLRTFAEIALEQITSDSDGGIVAKFNFGGTLRLGDNVQMDAASSVGLNDRSDDFSVTVGVSVLVGGTRG